MGYHNKDSKHSGRLFGVIWGNDTVKDLCDIGWAQKYRLPRARDVGLRPK